MSKTDDLFSEFAKKHFPHLSKDEASQAIRNEWVEIESEPVQEMIRCKNCRFWIKSVLGKSCTSSRMQKIFPNPFTPANFGCVYGKLNKTKGKKK